MGRSTTGERRTERTNSLKNFLTNKHKQLSLIPKSHFALLRTIIFNNVPDQWGAFQYDESKDALRVVVTPKPSQEMNERLKYEVNPSGFSLFWENLEVPVMIK